LQGILPDKPPELHAPHIVAITVHTIAEALAFVQQHNGTRNLYYAVNPLKYDMNKKAEKTDVASVAYCLADCDPADGESSEAAKSRFLTLLGSGFDPKPTVIVNSGNGIQCLWRLDHPVDLTSYPVLTTKEGDKEKKILGPEARQIVDDVEARIKTIMERLGAKPGTQNIDRILRLPGTINLPNAAKRKNGRVPCPTELLAFNDASYSLDAFPLPEPTTLGTSEDGGHARQQEEPHGAIDVDALSVSDRIKDLIRG
jgi:hypothetical protein